MSARDPAFADRLRRRVKGEVREGEPLARYSTYRIGGPATFLLPTGPEDVVAGLTMATGEGVSWFALGLGSNVLLPDEGLDALVIRMGKGLDTASGTGGRWTLGAGLPAPLAARKTAEAGWAGLHKMVGVPGSVGGGVFMNAGCHGSQWSDVVVRVTVLNPAGQTTVLAREHIPFAYRRSGLEGVVVLETEVELNAEQPERLVEEVNDLFRWRQHGTPFNKPCCGSVFQNPVGAPEGGLRTAGQLIDAAGLKGFRIGGAQVSPVHANYIVNTGRATALDVRRTIAHVRLTVREKLGVSLETEVKVVGRSGEYVTGLVQE